MRNKVKVALLVLSVVLVVVGTVLLGNRYQKNKELDLARQQCERSLEMICVKAYDCGGFSELSQCTEGVKKYNICSEKLLDKSRYENCLEDLKVLRCSDGLPTQCEYLVP